MAERQSGDGNTGKALDARAERLAAALRENLKKRKARARAASTDGPADPADADS